MRWFFEGFGVKSTIPCLPLDATFNCRPHFLHSARDLSVIQNQRQGLLPATSYYCCQFNRVCSCPFLARKQNQRQGLLPRLFGHWHGLACVLFWPNRKTKVRVCLLVTVSVAMWWFFVACERPMFDWLLNHPMRVSYEPGGGGWREVCWCWLQLTDFVWCCRLLFFLWRPSPALSTAMTTNDHSFIVIWGSTGVEATAAASRPDPDCAILSESKALCRQSLRLSTRDHSLRKEREREYLSRNTCLLSSSLHVHTFRAS